MTLRVPPGFKFLLNSPKPKEPTFLVRCTMLEQHAALEQQQTLSRECSEFVLTSNNLTDFFSFSLSHETMILRDGKKVFRIKNTRILSKANLKSQDINCMYYCC